MIMNRRKLLATGISATLIPFLGVEVPKAVVQENIQVLDKSFKYIIYIDSLHKDLTDILRDQLFEFNDYISRHNVSTDLYYYFQSRPEYTNVVIECSETNNTPEVIDSNDFIVDIDYYKNNLKGKIRVSLKTYEHKVDYII